jgi:hypothetical protein
MTNPTSTNPISIFSRALLALVLLAGAGAATAGPMVHVALDTSGTAGDGYLQIDSLPFGTNDVLAATVSGFTGAFDGAPELVNVTQEGGTFTFTSAAFSELFQAITLGGAFGFDVGFDGLPTDGGSTGLSVSLLDAAGDYLSFQAAQISLVAGMPPIVAADSAFATVTAVPEPAGWMLVVTGLALLAALQHRRVNRTIPVSAH